MNDQELDDMLDTWQPPPVPPSLRENVRAGFTARRLSAIAPPSRPSRRFRFVAALAGIAATLVLAVQAFPQAARLFSGDPIPYTVDSEIVMHPMYRAPRAYMTLTSYNQNGKEVVLTWTFPNNPIVGAIHRSLGQLGSLFSQIAAPFIESPEEAELARNRASVITGCDDHACLNLRTESLGQVSDLLGRGCAIGEVVGRETILGHPTLAVRPQRDGQKGWRRTFWLAPDLGCFALQFEADQEIDGVYRTIFSKRALRVAMATDPR